LPERASLTLDCDGVILDCRPRQVAVAAHLATALGLEDFDPALFWQAKRQGANTKQALLELGSKASVANKLHRDWMAEIEAARWLKLDRVLPGVTDALALLRQHYDLALLSARHDEAGLLKTLSALGLSGYFADITVVEPAQVAQQKAESLRAAGSWALIGDSESDAQAAELAQIEFWGLSCGQRSKDFLLDRGCRVFSSLLSATPGLISAGPQASSATA
jgi:phosphoglycolate phosphatase-like HAD superfamily hydrolase